jgi:hypothetical protein
MHDTPTSQAFTRRQEYRDRINKLRNEISDLQIELSQLAPVAQLAFRYSQAATRISRLQDQIRVTCPFIDRFSGSHSFSQSQFRPFASFLQTQIGLAAADWTRLWSKMRSEEIADITVAIEQALGATRPRPALDEESAASVRLSLLEKWKNLNFASTDEFTVRREMQTLWQFLRREEESYSKFAAQADEGLNSLARKTQEFETQLAGLHKELRNSQDESSSVSTQIDRKMAKLSLVTDLMKGKTGENAFLQAAAALFGMLQTGVGTDEQIRLCLGSVVAIARANAQSEDPGNEALERPPNQESLEAALQALRQRIADRRLHARESPRSSRA